MDDTTPVPKKRSAAMSKAQKAYYERNRDKRLEEMRSRARERNAAERDAAEADPLVLAERRKRFLEKYYIHMMKDTQRRIDVWMADANINKEFKAFLKTNVEPVKTLLPRKFFNTLNKLSIVAEKPVEINTLIELVDGDKPTTADIYASSQTIKEW